MWLARSARECGCETATFHYGIKAVAALQHSKAPAALHHKKLGIYCRRLAVRGYSRAGAETDNGVQCTTACKLAGGCGPEDVPEDAYWKAPASHAPLGGLAFDVRAWTVAVCIVAL
jgi:hypothetical protein